MSGYGSPILAAHRMARESATLTTTTVFELLGNPPEPLLTSSTRSRRTRPEESLCIPVSEPFIYRYNHMTTQFLGISNTTAARRVYPYMAILLRP